MIKNHSLSGSGIDENNVFEIEVGLMAVIMDINTFSIRPAQKLLPQDLETCCPYANDCILAYGCPYASHCLVYNCLTCDGVMKSSRSVS